jgi:hypothetical protein
MRIRTRVLPLVALAAALAAHSAQAQQARSPSAEVPTARDSRVTWYFGAEGGAMFFETQAQTSTGIPFAGAQVVVRSRRAGLMFGVDEGFGSKEPSAFLDSSDSFSQREVTFDHIRRYAFTMTGYPVHGALEPYLGVGFGITQVVNPQVGGVFISNDAAAASAASARDVSATGSASFMAGVQFRVGRLAAFGQYQINTAPAANNILRGPLHLLTGGLRFSLGNAREDIKGGGY